jgi:hypothetical protein
LSTLTLLGSSLCNGMGAVEYQIPIWVLALVVGWVLWSTGNTKESIAQVGAKKELSNGMGAVEYPNPIGF